MLFLVEKGQKSYIASAVNLRYLEGASGTLPALAAACLEPLNSELDKNSYAVLESNGFVWTFQSLLSSNKEKITSKPKSKYLFIKIASFMSMLINLIYIFFDLVSLP